MGAKKFKPLYAELTLEEYAKVQRLVEAGRYRTKIAVVREALRLVE